MKQQLVISRLDQLRALADPLRLRIIDALSQRDRSVAQLAVLFRVPAPRLYHHIDLMLEAGLIEVTRRVRRRGAEERLLRAVAEDYTLARSLFGPADRGPGTVQALLEMGRSILASVSVELAEGVAAGAIDPGKRGRGMLLHDRSVALTAPVFETLARELPVGIDAHAARRSAGRRTRYRFVLVAYPIDDPTSG